jgi:hypothetical protein
MVVHLVQSAGLRDVSFLSNNGTPTLGMQYGTVGHSVGTVAHSHPIPRLSVPRGRLAASSVALGGCRGAASAREEHGLINTVHTVLRTKSCFAPGVAAECAEAGGQRLEDRGWRTDAARDGDNLIVFRCSLRVALC